jgi:hypothetical protein
MSQPASTGHTGPLIASSERRTVVSVCGFLATPHRTKAVNPRPTRETP